VLICADSRAALAELEEGSVQCCITSPPYWGLRKYGDAAEAIFGGDAGCEHVWGLERIVKRGHPGDKSTLVGTQTAQISKAAGNQGAFCQLCSAWRGQFGLEPTPEMYVEHMLDFLRAIWRVLRDDGTLWLNLGDSYFGGRSSGRQPKDAKGAEQARQTKNDWKTCQYCGIGFLGYPTQRFCSDACGGVDNTPRQVRFGMKPKDLVMIPFRVALAAQADGAADPKAMQIIQRVQSALLADHDTWEEVPKYTRREIERLDEEYCQAHKGAWWVRSTIIWSKPNPMPESVRDRPTTAHEYVFLLTKSKTYFYDADAIREPAVCQGDTRHLRGDSSKEPGGPRDDGGSRLRTGNPVSGRNKRTVWEIATAAYSGAHYATFPPKLVEPMILTTPTKVCAECGAGWERVTESRDTGKRVKMPDGWDTGSGGHGSFHRQGREKGETAKAVMESVTLGFRPTCSCPGLDGDHPGSDCADYDENWPTKPAVILDPFCGRGTVLKEARAHGRDWIGIDVDPQSIKLAEEWLGLGPVEYETPEESWIQPRLTITEPG